MLDSRRRNNQMERLKKLFGDVVEMVGEMKSTFQEKLSGL